MAAIRALTQLREMARSKVLRAAPRTRPLDLTRSLAIPQAVITRQLVLAPSAATRAAVITQPMVLVLSFLIPSGRTIPPLGFKRYLSTVQVSKMRLLVREHFLQTRLDFTTRPMAFSRSRETQQETITQPMVTRRSVAIQPAISIQRTALIR